MKENGIKAFADMYSFPEATIKAAQKLDMPVVVGVDISYFIGLNRENLYDEFGEYLSQYSNNNSVKIALPIPSLLNMDEKSLEFIAELSKKHDIPIHIHMSETEQEVIECKRKIGLSPVEYASRLELLGKRTVLSHCVWVSNKDIEIISGKKSSVVHCPLSNLKLGSGVAPVVQMLESGINVSLGTDGAASSGRLDIWEAGKYAVLVQRGIFKDATKITAKDVFKMMSSNGMRALGLDTIEGLSLEDIEKEIEEYDEYEILYYFNINQWMENQ